jgi:TolA-binding protein
MEELTDDAKDMLDALKADETPSKASSDRMWSAVAAGGAGAALLAGIGKGKLLLLGALGITGVVALVLVAAPGAGPGGGDGEASPAVAAHSEGVEDRPVRPEPAPEDPEIVEAPEPEPEIPEAPEPKAAEPDERVEKPKPQPAPDDLEKELSLLGDAKSALRQGDTAEALGILNRHRKDFPRSSFGEEREFLRMTALCDSGKKDKARKVAERFLKKHPSSALSPRVEKLCQDP